MGDHSVALLVGEETRRHAIFTINGFFNVDAELVRFCIDNVVLRQMAEHIPVPLTLQVSLEVSTALPFFVHDDAARMVEVSSP